MEENQAGRLASSVAIATQGASGIGGAASLRIAGEGRSGSARI
jgi:hypothetical protein